MRQCDSHCSELYGRRRTLALGFSRLASTGRASGIFRIGFLPRWSQGSRLDSIELGQNVIPMAKEVLIAEVAPAAMVSVASISAEKNTFSVKTWMSWSAGIAAAVLVALFVRYQMTQTPSPNGPNNIATQQTTNENINTMTATVPVNAATSPSRPTASIQISSIDSTYSVGSVFNRKHISLVGYSVADGITPVTKSVSAALQSLKKPLEKDDETPIQPMKSSDSSFAISSSDVYV